MDEVTELLYEGSFDDSVMIWQEGWPEWKLLTEAFPELYEENLSAPLPEPTKPLTGTHICQWCHFVGNPIKPERGNIAVEIILWLLCLVPGIFYSIWRRGAPLSGCPSCGKGEMIPVNYPIGASLAEGSGYIIDWTQVIRESAKPEVDKTGDKLQGDYMERELRNHDEGDDDGGDDMD